MIDKSIRQHYQEGDKVNYFKKGKDIIMSAVPQVKKITPTSIAKNVVTQGVGKKLAGTSLLASLGPIGALLAMFLARKGINYASEKIPEDIGQAFTSGIAGLGFGSPQEGRELRKLEKRRANMLQRKEEGKSYSDKNLGIVTRAIAEAKGIDINNPNEMRNIDKDISNLYNKTIIPQVIPGEPEVKIPHLGKDEDIITRPTVEDTAAMEDIITRPTVEDTAANEDIINKIIAPIYSNPNEDRAREEKEAFDRAVAENAAKAAAEAAAQRAYAARVPDRVYHQPQGGGRNGGGGQAAADAAGGSSYSSPFNAGGPVYTYPRKKRGINFFKGGRIDKALGGKVRDI